MENHRKTILRVLLGCLLAPAFVCAQTPKSAQAPGSGQLSPAQVPSRAQLATQVKRAVMDLAAMKNSGKVLPSDEEAKLGALLLRAAELTGDLEKPQIEASELSQLASEVSDLQKEVGALKMLVQ